MLDLAIIGATTAVIVGLTVWLARKEDRTPAVHAPATDFEVFRRAS